MCVVPPAGFAVPASASAPAALRERPEARVGALDPRTGSTALAGLPPQPVSAPEWIDVTPLSHAQLPIIEWPGGTWDAADGYLLVTDGDSDSGFFNHSWAYSAGNWTELTTEGSPGPLAGLSMAYDAAASEVVMFGGIRSGSPLEYNNTTWTYRAGVWSAHSLVPSPPSTYGASMVYDAGLGGVLLYGGLALPSTTECSSSLWLYRDGSWTELHPTEAPPARYSAQMTYDPLTGTVVLYGGVDDADTIPSGTWIFSSGNWSALPVEDAEPPLIAAGMMDYDSDLDAVVLAEGINVSDDYSTVTWTYNASGWAELDTVQSPGAAFTGVGAWDPVDHEFLIAGGNETASKTWALVEPVAVNASGLPSVGDVGRRITFSPGLLGGPRPVRYAWAVEGDFAGNASNLTFTFPDNGTYPVSLEVTAPDGQKADWSGEFTASLGPSLSLEIPVPAVDAGVNLTLTADVTGGVAPYYVLWAFGDGDLGTGLIVGHAWNLTGALPISAEVVDADGANATAQASIQVAPDPTISFVELYSSVHPCEVGVAEPFGVDVAGGIAPFSVAWSFAGGGNASGTNVTHAYGAAGTANVSAVLTDGDDVQAEVNATVLVVPRVAVELVGPAVVVAGASTRWSVNVTGGFGPYEESWIFPGGTRRSGAAVDQSLSSLGQGPVEVWANDSAGGTAFAEVNVTVIPPSPSLAPSLGPVSVLAIGGVLAAAVIAVALYFVLRGRSRPPPPPRAPRGGP